MADLAGPQKKIRQKKGDTPRPPNPSKSQKTLIETPEEAEKN